MCAPTHKGESPTNYKYVGMGILPGLAASELGASAAPVTRVLRSRHSAESVSSVVVVDVIKRGPVDLGGSIIYKGPSAKKLYFSWGGGGVLMKGQGTEPNAKRQMKGRSPNGERERRRGGGGDNGNERG